MGDMEMQGAGEGVPTTFVDTQRALELVRTAMDQLAAEVVAEARELAGPELRLQQALALPRRAAALRDLLIALRELISLERRQLGLDDPSRVLKACVAMAACAGAIQAPKEAAADGQ